MPVMLRDCSMPALDLKFIHCHAPLKENQNNHNKCDTIVTIFAPQLYFLKTIVDLKKQC